MVGFIRGNVLEMFSAGKNVVSVVIWPHSTSVEGFGVGYAVLMSDFAESELVSGKPIEVWTYHVQGERESYLIGFTTSAKLRMFLSLMEVSGVGPKTGLQIVDRISSEEFRDAIESNDVAVFNKVPGIGKKIAAKIIVELSGKEVNLGKVLPAAQKKSEYPEVVATLKKLGYSTAAAQEAVQKALPQLSLSKDLSVAEQVKLVLSCV